MYWTPTIGKAYGQLARLNPVPESLYLEKIYPPFLSTSPVSKLLE
jgi:hypothetical protein